MGSEHADNVRRCSKISKTGNDAGWNRGKGQLRVEEADGQQLEPRTLSEELEQLLSVGHTLER
jgi:hypothetical protein